MNFKWQRMGNEFNLERLNAILDFKRLKKFGHSIGMDENIDGCGNCMHAMMQRK